ncbi:hypothetical protein ACWDUN_29880 [Mycobacterium sp. NPDC003323]
METPPRRQQHQFAFRLKEQAAEAFRAKLSTEFVRQQDVLETLAAAWVTGRLDIRALREELSGSGLL